MISLFLLFWMLVVLFAIIGAMRGWSKEVIAMAGLTLSLFAINTFGHLVLRLTGGIGADECYNFTLCDSQRNIPQGLKGAMKYVNMTHIQQSIILHRLEFLRNLCAT